MSPLGWTIAAVAIVLVLVRPLRINEAWWAAGGALLLVAVHALAPGAALAALARGGDVYLFLIGMTALAAFANVAGVFAWVAARARDLAGGSRRRLFALVYLAGIATTALLSNDATIVVLTPAVIDALRRFDAPPFPYVVACALVANAASFVLPISNPSNLLVFAGRMPGLGAWLAAFALPSAIAIAVTYAVAALWCRRDLHGEGARDDADDPPPPKRHAIVVLALAATIVVTVSAREGPLGAATFACALGAWIVALANDREHARTIVRTTAWPVVALTAALFVIVAAVDAGGGLAATQAVLAQCAALPGPWSNIAAGFAVAAASNLTNNLPIGLNLGEALPAMHAPLALTRAALIGVNLGPNATVNGSLATLLWLAILRRAGIEVSAWRFAAIGTAATIPSLLAALLVL